MKHARRKPRSRMRDRVASTTGALAVILGAGIGTANAAGKAAAAPVAKEVPLDAANAAHAADAPGAMTLPAPSGHYQVGMTNLHLRDTKRTDPWLPDGRPRELMVSLWYPATHTSSHPAAPYLE